MALSRRGTHRDLRAAATLVALLALAAGPRRAAAAPGSPEPTAATGTSTRAPALVPPRPLTPLVIQPPGPVRTATAVTVRLRVDVDGAVIRSELVRTATPTLDRAVLEGVFAYGFEPATWAGRPVAVDVGFTQRFLPTVTATAATRTATRTAPRARLELSAEERGHRTPVAGATVIVVPWATPDLLVAEATTDAEGRAALELPPGEYRVEVLAGGFLRFTQRVTAALDAPRRATYLLDRSGPNDFEVFVRGRTRREAVSTVELRGRELTQVPGTFGDPFRVISALPGTTQLNSLLPFPIVRGSSPGNSGFLIDGVRVPLLFHLLAGPSVIHPAFIESIEFSPGAFPVEYGGYTGGIVDGKTRPARRDERLVDVDLNLFQLGGLVRAPLGDTGLRGTVAGRLGYPGLLISLATPDASVSYWDYQARVDAGDERSGFSVFALGARDVVSGRDDDDPVDTPLSELLRLEYHRLDLRYVHRGGDVEGTHQVTLGYDRSRQGDAAELGSFSVTPRLRVAVTATTALELRFGLDGLARWNDYAALAVDSGDLGLLLGQQGEPSNQLYQLGLLAEAAWRPLPRLLVRPGVRVDVYGNTRDVHVGVDPRLLARYQLSDRLTLKGGFGRYTQPPRFAVPIPGLDQIGFELGLLQALQTSAGAELRVDDAWSLDVQSYFNWMDPLFYDVNLNPTVDDVRAEAPPNLPGQAPTTPVVDDGAADQRLARLLRPATGRAYGVELLVRRRAAAGVTGWLSYTLSRSERLRDDAWVGYDFDRTHVLNLVVQIPLPRRWQLGFRAQLQSGRPLTTAESLAGGRTPTFARVDLRIDKTAVWNDWLLDFYVDISNALLAADELAPQQFVRFVLPTVGFRALF